MTLSLRVLTKVFVNNKCLPSATIPLNSIAVVAQSGNTTNIIMTNGTMYSMPQCDLNKVFGNIQQDFDEVQEPSLYLHFPQ